MKIREKFRQISQSELTRRGFESIFVQIGNKRGFIIVQKHQMKQFELIKNKKMFDILVEETVKISIMEQAMAMQVGRYIGREKTEVHPYRAIVLKTVPGNYCAWEFC
jgi:hypothetical protein